MYTTHHLQLTVTEDPASLERIVSVCRSRQCRILSLRFSLGDRHRAGQVEMTLSAPSRMADLAVARLARLVDVVAVARHGHPPVEFVGTDRTPAREFARSRG